MGQSLKLNVRFSLAELSIKNNFNAKSVNELLSKNLGADENLDLVMFEYNVMNLENADVIYTWLYNNKWVFINDDGSNFISRSDLGDLSDVCRYVLANKNLAEQILPIAYTYETLNYDDQYFEVIRYTADKIDDLLADDKYDCGKFYYIVDRY
jgi:hypothetical protein